MSRKSSFVTILTAAAVSGLLAGSAARVNAMPASVASPTQSRVLRAGSSAVSGALAGIRTMTDDAKGQHDCKGKNDCKGQGGCKTGDSGCKGKNTCKGKGGCSTKSTPTPTPTPKKG